MIQNNIQILFVTETLGTEQKEKEMRKVFSDYDMIYRGTRKNKCKKYLIGGRIACIAKQGTVKKENESQEDDTMLVSWNNIFIACACLVHPSSFIDSRSEEKMEEIQQRLLRQDRCVIMVDANVWIGETPSIVASGDIEAEDDDTVYTRSSVNNEMNKQRNNFVEKINNINMIILNGEKTKHNIHTSIQVKKRKTRYTTFERVEVCFEKSPRYSTKTYAEN